MSWIPFSYEYKKKWHKDKIVLASSEISNSSVVLKLYL